MRESYIEDHLEINRATIMLRGDGGSNVPSLALMSYDVLVETGDALVGLGHNGVYWEP